jgi:hypothetical protein
LRLYHFYFEQQLRGGSGGGVGQKIRGGLG